MKNFNEEHLLEEQETTIHNHTLKEALEAKRLAVQQTATLEKASPVKQNGHGEKISKKGYVRRVCLSVVVVIVATLLVLWFLESNSFYTLFHINPLKSDDMVISIDQYEVSRNEYLSYIVPAKQLLEETYGAEAIVQRDEFLDIVQQYAEESLFGRYTLMKWAEEYGITVDSIPDEEFTAKKETLIAQCGGKAAYKTYLTTWCTTEEVEDLKLRQELVIEKLTYRLSEGEDPILTVTDAQVQDYYQENKLYTIKHILLCSNDFTSATEKLESAKKILTLALDGYGFDELVKLYSEDAEKATYLKGYICELGGQETAFEKAALSVKPGEIYADVISTSYGYHVLMRIEPTVEVMHEQLDDLIVDERVMQKRVELQSQMLVNYSPGYNNINFSRINEALAG